MYLVVAILLFLAGIGVTLYFAKNVVYQRQGGDDEDIGFALGMGAFISAMCGVGWPILLPMAIIGAVVYGFYVAVLAWIKRKPA